MNKEESLDFELLITYLRHPLSPYEGELPLGEVLHICSNRCLFCAGWICCGTN